MQIEAIRRMAHDILENQHVENDFIEYKKSENFKDKILKTACAFANNYMNREIGLIFIGVEEVDDRETGEKAIPRRPISGIKESLIESTENSLKQLLSHVHPRIDYHFISDRIDNREYLVIAIEPGKMGPYETSSKAEKDKTIGLKAGRYIRVRRDSRLPIRREEFELLKKFAEYCFSSELNETATIDDLSYEYMKEYLVQTRANPDIRKLSKLDMAKSMGLISESEYGGYRAKNFAVLMFSEKPDQFIPYAHVEIIREAVGTDKMEAKIFDGPIWIQAKQVRKYFQDNILASYTIRDEVSTTHRLIYNWPQVVFNELSTNCILHKEYDSPNYIGIYIYDDKITFVNHNRPMPPVTIEDLNNKRTFDDRRYLNPELKEMFFALNLIESYGSGIRRAKDALSDNGSPKLQFLPENDTDDYTMAVVGINEEFLEVRREEESAGQASGNAEMPQEITQKTDQKTEITQEIAQETKITQEITQEIAQATKITQEITQEIAQETKITQKMRTETVDEQEDDISQRIKQLMSDNSCVSLKEVADMLNVKFDFVRYRVKCMKKNGEIRHEGPTKSGKWVVLK